MGSICSSIMGGSSDATEATRESIEERLRNLETQVDKNKDGIVTKDEMHHFLSEKLTVWDDTILDLKNKIRKKDETISQMNIDHSLEIQKLENDIESLKKENKHIKDVYNILQKEHESTLDHVRNGRPIEMSFVSDAAIKRYVHDRLANPETNSFVPDILEGAAIEQSAKMYLHGMEKIFEAVGFDMIGHTLKVVIVPKDDEIV